MLVSQAKSRGVASLFFLGNMGWPLKGSMPLGRKAAFLFGFQANFFRKGPGNGSLRSEWRDFLIYSESHLERAFPFYEAASPLRAGA